MFATTGTPVHSSGVSEFNAQFACPVVEELKNDYTPWLNVPSAHNAGHWYCSAHMSVCSLNTSKLLKTPELTHLKWYIYTYVSLDLQEQTTEKKNFITL